MATYHAEDLVLGIEVHDRIEEALKPFQYVVGSTARMGSHRQFVKNPRHLALELIPISRKNHVALLFGPEAGGLTNEHIRYCDVLVTIPTAGFSSINLAQAVMIMLYEIFTAASEKKEGFTPRLATRGELEAMYAQLKDTLTKINFINPENPDYWMDGIRRFFSRMELRGRDVQLIRGICRQIDWYCFKKTEKPRKKISRGLARTWHSLPLQSGEALPFDHYPVVYKGHTANSPIDRFLLPENIFDPDVVALIVNLVNSLQDEFLFAFLDQVSICFTHF